MLLGILILQTCLILVKSSVILSPSPALAADGESFTWTCTYSGSETVSGFVWSLNGNTLAIILPPACTPFVNPGPPDSTLYEYACLSTSQATFTVKKISNMNNGDKWQCAVAAPGYIYSNNVTITVQGLILVKSSVILSPSPALAADGESFTWTCTYSGSETVSGFIWSLNGNTLAIILSPACTPFSVPGPPNSSLYDYACLSTSQATFTVKKISNMNNGDKWQCAVAAPEYTYSNNVTITVQETQIVG